MWLKILTLATTGVVWGSLAHDFQVFSRVNGYPECEADLNTIVSAFQSNQFWVLKILDSWTKLPSGLLTGHFVDYGNYDECFNSGGTVPMQYCLASIIPSPHEKNSTSAKFRGAYCMPSSCPPTVIESILKDVLKTFSFIVSVEVQDCSLKNSKSISTGEYIGIWIWGVFVGLAVLSTIYDVLVEKEGGRKNKFLSSFSIYTNGRNLLKTEVPPETMLPIHGLRFLSICWVVLGHRYFFTATSSLLNLQDFAEELKKIQSQFFIQGVLAVDTFFLLSGLLNTYHLLQVLQKLGKFPVARYYIHRYIRLTPVLAAIVLMYATWYTLIGDGPVWNQTTSEWKQLCIDNWLPTLLYINNYYNPITQCAGQSWYLAVDMQLYWLSPIVVIPLWKRPKAGKLLLGLLLIASTVSVFVIAFIQGFRMSFDFGLSTEEYKRVTELIYVPTHTRATPYLIGMMIGHYLHMLKKENSRLVLPKGAAFLGWVLSTLIALSVVFGNYQFSRPVDDHPYDRWESSLYIALHRIGWGVAIGWIIIACLSNQGGIVNNILSFKLFVPLSRLTYCIFLSHMAIQQYNIGTARTSDYFQHFNQVHRYFGDLILSVFAAAALSLLFESPILVLEKLTGGKPQERNLKSEVNNGFQDDSAATDKTHEI